MSYENLMNNIAESVGNVFTAVKERIDNRNTRHHVLGITGDYTVSVLTPTTLVQYDAKRLTQLRSFTRSASSTFMSACVDNRGSIFFYEDDVSQGIYQLPAVGNWATKIDFEEGVTALAVSRSGRLYIASNSETESEIHCLDRQREPEWSVVVSKATYGSVIDVCVDTDDNVVLATEDGYIALYDDLGTNPIWISTILNTIQSVRIRQDGYIVVSGRSQENHLMIAVYDSDQFVDSHTIAEEEDVLAMDVYVNGDITVAASNGTLYVLSDVMTNGELTGITLKIDVVVGSDMIDVAYGPGDWLYVLSTSSIAKIDVIDYVWSGHVDITVAANSRLYVEPGLLGAGLHL